MNNTNTDAAEFEEELDQLLRWLLENKATIKMVGQAGTNRAAIEVAFEGQTTPTVIPIYSMMKRRLGYVLVRGLREWKAEIDGAGEVK